MPLIGLGSFSHLMCLLFICTNKDGAGSKKPFFKTWVKISTGNPHVHARSKGCSSFLLSVSPSPHSSKGSKWWDTANAPILPKIRETAPSLLQPSCAWKESLQVFPITISGESESEIHLQLPGKVPPSTEDSEAHIAPDSAQRSPYINSAADMLWRGEQLYFYSLISALINIP